jgi:hypothetical protein
MDAQLASFATVRQLEILEAVEKYGSERKAAKALGLSHGTIANTMAAIKRKAALQGYSPAHDMTRTVPDGFKVKGVSTYYDDEGKPRGQWVKSQAEQGQQEQILREALEGFKDEIPRLAPMPAPSVLLNGQLCNCYVVTDFHLNALSWHEETGANWDVAIAEDTLVGWFAQAIAQSPNASTAVLAQLSDLLHSDGLEPLTPASKHVLDVDTRFQKVVRIVIRVLRRVIDMLLAKHERLHIIMADANHDPVSQIWLREWLSVLYENDPRVTVDREPSPYNAYEFGRVALFFHHGHKRKVANVSEVFAAKYREMFGRTRHAYAHMGHLHHLDIKENSLMVVEQHRTLTAPDAYAARGGYISGRDAQVITYHREFGEVSRVKVSYDMVRSFAPEVTA